MASMQYARKIFTRSPGNTNSRIRVRSLHMSNAASLRILVISLLESLSLKPGATLLQNCGDSEIGKLVIQVAKERKYKTISTIDDKPGIPDIIEELKALGRDIVVPESYTKTWYMERLVGDLNPSAGLNFSDGFQATAVGKAVATGGTFLTYGKKLPQYVVFEGADLKPVEWTAFLKEKNLKLKALGM